MKARLLILALLLSSGSLLADVYPYRMRIEEKVVAPDHGTTRIDPISGRYSSLSVGAAPSSLSITVTINDQIVQASFTADSLMFASWNGKAWNLILASGPSIVSASISDKGASDLTVVRPLTDVFRVSHRHSMISFCTRDSVITAVPKSVTDGFVVHSVPSFPRSVIAACRANTDLFALTSLSDNSLTIERWSNGTWASLGALSAYENIADVSGAAAASLVRTSTSYAIVMRSLNGTRNERVIEVPTSLLEPRRLELFDDTVVVVFATGIAVIGPDGLMAVSDVRNDGNDDVDIDFRLGRLCVSRRGESLGLLLEKDPWFRLRKTFDLVEEYAVRILVLAFILYLLFRMLSYRQLLRDVLEHTSRGISFVVDRNMRLRRINKRGRELFSMDAETPLRRALSFYCHTETQFDVERFVASALVARSFSTFSRMITSGGSEQEVLFTAQPVFGVSGSFNGLVVTGIDITEQLEQKRLVNWAQLAHDMQTNLSVIRLNAEQMDIDNASTSFLDQRRRIIHQSKLLLQRVRDIVSIGRDDILHAEEADLRDFYARVVQEFDDASFGAIDFVVSAKPVRLTIDASKLSRAIRNAVENAIRALPEKTGTIELGYRMSSDHVSLFVRDTGLGMDDQSKANFFRPFFSNYRQFGGTGIGTMIMQRALALHNGHITLESEPGVGTTIFFHLPRSVYAG